MNFGQYIGDAFRTLLFREDSIYRIKTEEKGIIYGLLVLVIAGITTSFYTFNISSMITNILSLLVFVVIGFLFFHFIAVGFFNGKAAPLEYAKVLVAPFIVFWISIIPVIGNYVQVIGSLLLIIVNIFFLRTVHGLNKVKAILLGILPIIILIAYVIIVGSQEVL